MGAYVLPGPLGGVPGDGDLGVVVDVLVLVDGHGVRLGHGIGHVLVHGHGVGPVDGHGHRLDDGVGLGHADCVRLGNVHWVRLGNGHGHLLHDGHGVGLVDGHRLRDGHSVAAERGAVVSQASAKAAAKAGCSEVGRVVRVSAEVDAALRLGRIVVVCGGGLGRLIFMSQRHRQCDAEQTQLWNQKIIVISFLSIFSRFLNKINLD